jgi:hypothetical protein
LARQQDRRGRCEQRRTLACHWSSTDDYYLRAVRQGIQLRITVLQTALTNLINTLVGLNTNSRFRPGLYSFNTKLNIIYPPGSQYVSADIAGASGSIPGIAPAIICATCLEPETFFSVAMASLTKLALPAPQQANIVPQAISVHRDRWRLRPDDHKEVVGIL